ncbi:MAG TPA: DUF1080 domain-containing protein [Acidobacteriota bacterium]|nr:DUF1080 domain-containing protein [Acidobacteriota bacterium]
MTIYRRLYAPFRRHFLIMSLFIPVSLGVLHPVEGSDNAITPTRVIDLFNGKDLSNFYTWLVDYKFEDPHRVFTVVEQIDGAPAIRISGEHWGGIITREAYRDYHLIVEFRWGLLSWGSRKNRPRDSGILLHSQGPEGNSSKDYNGPWMASIECQMIEGGTGDMILVEGYLEDGEYLVPIVKSTIRETERGNLWDPEGKVATIDGARVNWFGKDPNLRNEFGTRGRNDVENPAGMWNRLEVIADGDTLTYTLNGTVINKAFDANLTSGKILIQSEGAELYLRRVELRPLESQNN